MNAPRVPREGRTWPWVAATVVVLVVILLSVPLDRVAEALG